MQNPTFTDISTFRVVVPTAQVAAFQEAMSRAEYAAVDTGERIMTEEGPDAESVVLLALPSIAVQPRADGVETFVSR